MDGILKPALVLMCGRVLGYAACFAIPIVLVRVFDQATFGTYKQLFLIYGTLYAVAQFGVAESLFYFLPDDARRAGRYAANALLALAAAGGLCAGLLWAFQSPVARLLGNEALVDMLPLVGLYTLFMLMASVLEIVMTARKRHVMASATYAISDTMRAAIYILPALLFRNLEWLLVWTVVFAALRFAATVFYLRHEFGREFGPQARLLARQAAYAGPFGLAILVEIAQSHLHLYFVSYHFDAATFAIYAVACLQIPIVDFLATSTGNVLMVRMRELASAGSSGVAAIWNDAIHKLALVLFPLVGGLLVTAHEFITVLFTRDYAASVPVFMVWTLGFLFAVLPTDSALRVFAQNRYLLAVNLVRLALVVSLITVFMDAFGLIGPVAVTLLAIAAAKAFGLVRVARLLGVRVAGLLPWRGLARTFALATAAAAPALAVKATLPWPAVPLLLIAGTVYAVSYWLLLLLFGRLDDDERFALTGWLQWPAGALARARRS